MKRFHSYRCVEGRKMRHDPQFEDPDLETDVGVCEDCEGEGCEQDAEAAYSRIL